MIHRAEQWNSPNLVGDRPIRGVPISGTAPGERISHSERVAGKPLPPPEWFDEMRRLHLSYSGAGLMLLTQR